MKVLTFQQMAFLENQVPKLKSNILLTTNQLEHQKIDIQKFGKSLEEIRNCVEKIRKSDQKIIKGYSGIRKVTCGNQKLC